MESTPVGKLLRTYATERARARPGDNYELELRFRDLSRGAFEAAYSAARAVLGEPVLECTVNIIAPVATQTGPGSKPATSTNIRTSAIVNGVPAEPTYHRKSQAAHARITIDKMQINATLSLETVIPPFTITVANPLLRYKSRMSFIFGDWRYDFTAVRGTDMLAGAGSLKAIRTAMFPVGTNPDNYIAGLPHHLITAYEVEIEYIGKDVPSDLTTILASAMDIIQPSADVDLHAEIHASAVIVHGPAAAESYRRSDLKTVSNQVSALDKLVYYNTVIPAGHALITIKADGDRAWLRISDGLMHIIRQQSMVTSPAPAGTTLLCDVEMLTSPTGPYVRVFDVMFISDENVCADSYESRCTHIDSAVELIAATGYRAIPAEFRDVDFSDMVGVKSAVNEIFGAKYEHEVDGIIWSLMGEGYSHTRHFKWKPYEMNTIDFLAMKCPSSMLGVAPYVAPTGKTLYILCNGIDPVMMQKLGLKTIAGWEKIFPNTDQTKYFPIQFSPSALPTAYIYSHDVATTIDGAVVELSRNPDNTDWVFHRVRSDRAGGFGNDYPVAELTFNGFIDPFKLSDLWERRADYFSTAVNTIHTAPNRYKRSLITSLLKNNFAKMKFVCDEAAGRGADLFRYKEIGVEHALFIDIDASAITELISRKIESAREERKAAGPQKKWRGVHDSDNLIAVKSYDAIRGESYDRVIARAAKPMLIHTLVMDLTTPASEMLARVAMFGAYPQSINGVICNFALHYMCDSARNLANLLEFNSKILRVGGLFMFTVMDGAAIFEMLRDVAPGQSWESHEGPVLKYGIRRDYVGDKLAAVGQMIAVKLPFSSDLVPEPLCNIDAVLKAAARFGLAEELNAGMDTWAESFAAEQPMMSAALTDADREYIKLFRYVTLRKIK